MMKNELTIELQKQIENEAIESAKDCKDTDFDIGWNQGYEKGYEAAGEKYALKWQQEAEYSARERSKLNEKIRRYENALKSIEKEHECGCVPCIGQCRSREALAIELEEIKSIATEALTPKQTTDDTDR